MIIGAGLTGLIAAYMFPADAILEAQKEPQQMHNALLRFRTDAVSNLTGIPFREVVVRKGIWFGGQFVAPTIQVANMYSMKCLGKLLGERSIWNLDPVRRFIAPPTFYELLVENANHRIEWGKQADYSIAKTCGRPFINTAPMPIVLSALGVQTDLKFQREPITVERFKVPHADAHQTIYFPENDHSMYRASITGDVLICEFIGEQRGEWRSVLDKAFNLPLDIIPINRVSQAYGKIAPIDNNTRRRLIHMLSVQHNIYSLGRFAIWKNILLDDMVQDAAIVKRLLLASEYDLAMASIRKD